MHETDDKLRERIAENIVYYRKQEGNTQAELAEKLNYSDKSISKWERGDATPDVFILSKIAKLYDITVQDLLSEKKVQKTRSRRIIITLLADGLVWLTMTILFSLAQIFEVLDSRAWLLFIYGIPIMGIVTQVFSVRWWNQVMQVISCSLIIWGTGLSLVLTLKQQSLLLLFVICAVLEVLLILFFLLKVQSLWREQKMKRKK